MFLSVFFTLILSKTIDINNINEFTNKNITLIKRSHSTCDPDGFNEINRQYAVSFYNQPDGSLGTLYDCEIHYDNTLITCKVDKPLIPDDFVGFRVRRSTAYNCNKYVCGQPTATRRNYIFDKNGKIRGDSKDLKVNIGNHFCYRYIYGKEKCDVNFEIISLKYQYNTPKVIYSYGKFIKSLASFVIWLY